jgi:hypothetical protein
MHARLHVQENGHIVITTRRPGIVHTTGARDLRFRIEWFSNRGWRAFGGEILSDREARDAIRYQRSRNRSIRWRLMAFNPAGECRVPHGWKGPL